MLATARFVLSTNDKLHITALPAHYCSSANEIFLSFDGREMSDHANAQVLMREVFLSKSVFPSPGESIHVDAVMNQHNLVFTKDALGAKSFGDCLRNSNDTIRAAKTQLVRSVHRKKNVTSQDQTRGRSPSNKRGQEIVARDVRMNNLNAVLAHKAGELHGA